MKHKVKHLHFITCVDRNRETIAGVEYSAALRACCAPPPMPQQVRFGMKHRVKHLHFIAGLRRNRKPIAWGGSARMLRAATNAAAGKVWHET
ncbi:MAG: hypothetical protein ACKO1K_04030 [Burkholderiales bacterium]